MTEGRPAPLFQARARVIGRDAKLFANYLLSLGVFVTLLGFRGVSLSSAAQGAVLAVVTLYTLLLLHSLTGFSLGPAPSVQWVSFPEFDPLAKRMRIRLTSGTPYGLYRGNGLAAYTDGIKGKVIFNQKALAKLSDREKVALAAHEFAHLRRRHPQTRIVVTALFLLGAGWTAFSDMPMVAVPLLVVMFVTLQLLGRSHEYLADRDAAAFTSPEDVARCIQRLGGGVKAASAPVPPSIASRIQRSLFVHPPLAERIRRLRSLAGQVDG